MSIEQRNDSPAPKITTLEAFLSPENKARLEFAKAQFGRVDKVLKATGLKDATGLIVNEGFLIKRTLDSITYEGGLHYGDGESLIIQYPLELEGFLEPDIYSEIIIDPTNDEMPLHASYSYIEDDGTPVTNLNFEEAIVQISDLLDELGFPPAEEQSLSPDDYDGLSTARAGFQTSHIPIDMDDLRS